MFSHNFLIRILIAGLHFNENFKCEQAKTKDGAEKMNVCFPKPKHGEFTPKPVLVLQSYSTRQFTIVHMTIIVTNLNYLQLHLH